MALVVLACLRLSDPKAFCDRNRTEGKRHNAAIVCL